MLETLYGIDFLTDYIRSCVVLATSHIVSKMILEVTSVPVTEISIANFSEVLINGGIMNNQTFQRFEVIQDWVSKLPVFIPDSEETLSRYAACAFISRLCEFVSF
jgi:hypothetical protein